MAGGRIEISEGGRALLYQAYDPEVLKRVQETELEILRDFIDLCDRHEIDYFGVGGTAIGAVRHQGFIPWDDDIDIGFLRKDYDRFLALAKEELSDKYEEFFWTCIHLTTLLTMIKRCVSKEKKPGFGASC